MPDTTDLVLLEGELPSAGAALKAIQALVGRAAGRDRARRADGRGRRGRLGQAPRPSALGGQIGDEAAAALVAGAGTDARALERELEKLSLLADDRPIELADVRALVPAGDDARVFELVDAIGNRNARAAVRAWRALARAGEDPHRLLSDGRAPGQAADPGARAPRPPAGRRPAWPRRSGCRRSWRGTWPARRAAWPTPALEAVLARLVRLDREAKTGGQELESSLELLVAELVAGRALGPAGPPSRGAS